MVWAKFSLENIIRKAQFFEKTFLLTNINIEIVLGDLFQVFSNAYFLFSAENLNWRSYTIAKVLLIISEMELINKKEFATATLDKNSETFIIYIKVLKVEVSIYPSYVVSIIVLQ